MSVRDHYLENARAQITAADALAMRDEVEAVHFLGPTLLLLGFGIEAFLKAVSLDAGVKTDVLRNKPYGHDLWSMWHRPETKDQRDQAEPLSRQCYQDLASDYVSPQAKSPTDPGCLPNLKREVPAADDFESHQRRLSDLYSNASDYALRYPVGVESVPEPMLLISVFDRLVRNYFNDTMIAEVP